MQSVIDIRRTQVFDAICSFATSGDAICRNASCLDASDCRASFCKAKNNNTSRVEEPSDTSTCIEEPDYNLSRDEALDKDISKVKVLAETRNTQKPSVRKDLLFLLLKITSIIAAFVLLSIFIFGVTRYQEASMYPAVKDGDLVVYFRYIPEHYIPQDVVAISLDGDIQFRRVIATAGDTVDIADGRLLINGAPQQETGITSATERYQEGVSFPLVVPEGQIFVLGDNRTESIDSRIYGCVDKEDTIGKVMMVIRKRGI